MSITSEPKLQLPKINGVTPKQQPKGGQSVATLQHPTAGDSVQFGASKAKRTSKTVQSKETQTDSIDQTESPKQPQLNAVQNFLHNTNGVKNVYAGLKGGFQGTFEKPLSKYWLGAVLISILTLPFALIIPGHHIVLVPGYMAARRVIHGLSRMYTGFTEPDKILNPEAAQES